MRYTLANFDDNKYKELIDRFHSSREGEAIDNFYNKLKKLEPGGFISDDLKTKLDIWCETSPNKTWGKARPYARQIRDMILDRTHGGGKMDFPSLSINVEEIFHMPCKYDSDWNAMYGITNKRKSAMVKDTGRGRPDSLHNQNSETFLTFFALANLDSWQQSECLAKPIRTKDDKLNDDFVTLMRLNQNDLWLKPKEIHFNPSHLFSTLSIQKKEMKYSIFFFEHDIMSLNSNQGEEFKGLSFLDISTKQKWSKFDGFIFLPTLRRCLFIESKLGRDIDETVKWRNSKIRISQITRALESAYLFTHHQDSAFHGWEYDYLFICPRQKYESGKKKYSRAIPRIQNPNLTELRDEEYLRLKEKMDPDPVKKSLFDDFLSTHHEHIHVLFWDQLFDVLEEIDQGFLAKYMKNQQLKDESMYEKWLSRLKLASIPYNKK